jgi:mannose-1-phosphate guanylyltransferase
MQVMILAAGRSTRLGSIGAARPKPLVPICGYPAVTFALAACARAGLRNVVINLYHHGDQIRTLLGDGSGFGVQVRYSVEEELLGTGGGIARARALFAPGPVLVINGKVVADLSLDAVIAAHRATPRGTLATMVLRPMPAGEFAPIAVDEVGRVVGIRGKRGQVTAYGAVIDHMFTGIHILERPLLDRLPAGVSDIFTHAYQPALEDGGRVHSLLTTGYFEEHSTPERYLAGNLALLRRPGSVSCLPGPLTGVDPTARIDATATLRPPVRIGAGAVVEARAVVGPEVALGAGSQVAAGAHLERTVVWENARAEGDLHAAVVTGEGTVLVPGFGGHGREK